MDFSFESYPTEGQIQDVTGSIPGALIHSGNSYHFMGWRLMTEDHWRAWLENAYNSSDYVEEGFVDGSIKRGLSALRVFGYQGTLKPQDPIVCEII